MRFQEKPEDRETLRRLLRQWEVEPTLPLRFREEVWARIRLAEQRSGAGQDVWSAVRDWIAHRGLRPAFAVVLTSVLLVAGAALGWTEARKDVVQVREELGQRYAQSVDPYRRFH
jgi:hypothetical protein